MTSRPNRPHPADEAQLRAELARLEALRAVQPVGHQPLSFLTPELSARRVEIFNELQLLAARAAGNTELEQAEARAAEYLRVTRPRRVLARTLEAAASDVLVVMRDTAFDTCRPIVFVDGWDLVVPWPLAVVPEAEAYAVMQQLQVQLEALHPRERWAVAVTGDARWDLREIFRRTELNSSGIFGMGKGSPAARFIGEVTCARLLVRWHQTEMGTLAEGQAASSLAQQLELRLQQLAPAGPAAQGWWLGQDDYSTDDNRSSAQALPAN